MGLMLLANAALRHKTAFTKLLIHGGDQRYNEERTPGFAQGYKIMAQVIVRKLELQQTNYSNKKHFPKFEK